MELLLVRHGLAGKADAETWPDDDLRPLTPKGRKAFKAAARGLRKQGPTPGLILASPALRTRETAVILIGEMGLRARALRPWDALHHSRDPEKALAALGRQGLPPVAALVGHGPWLGEFLFLLLCGGSHAGPAFAKGGAALLELPARGARALGRGRLRWLLTQDQLAALG
jgi:phosphohistidine phosphatase